MNRFINSIKLKSIISCFTILLLMSCHQEPVDVITENDFDSLEFADFVEKDFPFIYTSLDLRDIGKRFPKHNYASRAVAIQLGGGTYAAFDPDLLRWAVAWEGDFVSMKGVAQVSYHDFFNKNDGFPEILGEPTMATGIYPGWTQEVPVFEDIRTTITEADSLKWGPLPATYGRFKGMHTFEDQVILHYSIGHEKTNIYEMPSADVNVADLFTRTIRIEPFQKKLYNVIGEFQDITATEEKDGWLHIYHDADNLGEGERDVTLVRVHSKEKPESKLSIVDNRYVVLELLPQDKERVFQVQFWNGQEALQDSVKADGMKLKGKFPKFEKGGKSYWKEKVYTAGKLASDTAAYVLDELTLPVPNPWNRNFRAADIAFFKDGRAAVLTFSGDVWILNKIDKKLNKLEWQRFASGFFEPLSIQIYKEKIYVYGREGVTRLHDLNKDGNADYYENFAADVVQSIDSREWAGDMTIDDNGYIYLAKGGGTIPEGFASISDQKPKGFRASSVHAGTILRISPDGEETEIFSTGLRVPFMGLHPSTGFVTISDQQGNYVPATPVYHAEKDNYFGVLPADHFHKGEDIKKPITWIPHRIDQSSISQLWLTGNKMGPLDNSLIHFSFGRPGVFNVLVDSLGQHIQGGVAYIQADYPAPVLKGSMNPKDGQLYIAGFNLWGSNSNGISALTRLRYTGKPYYLPIAFHVGKQGLILTFSEKLDPESVRNLQNFEVKRWNYKRTAKYGSGHFLLNGEPGEESLPVLESHLGSDGKSILLVVPNMTEVMQMELNYTLKSKSGENFSNEFYFTVNDASPMQLDERFSSVDIDLDALNLSEEELSNRIGTEGEVSEKLGAALFQKYACAGCHSLDPDGKGKYGPPLVGIFESIREFTDGTSAKADEAYIWESILDSKKKIVKGYGDEMPSYLGVLKDHEVESLVLYIKSL